MFKSLKRAFALTDGLEELKRFSPITFFVERVFFCFQYLSPANLLFGTRTRAHEMGKDEEKFREVTVKRGRKIDGYVLCWFVVLLLCAVAAADSREPFKALIIFLPVLRIFDIMQVAINMVVFDHLRTTRKHSVSSVTRTLVMGLWNFVEMVIAFGILYSAIMPQIENAKTWFDPYYFSVITQLTIGYGDLTPIGVARMVTAVQGIVGVVYVVMMLSRFVSLMPRIGSVQTSENRKA